jgi:hypothetical protein
MKWKDVFCPVCGRNKKNRLYNILELLLKVIEKIKLMLHCMLN